MKPGIIDNLKKHPLAVAAFALTAVLTLLPLFKIGFTTSDDFQYYVTAQQGWDYWLMDHEAYAHDAGRFFILFTKFFHYVPYLGDCFALTKAIQYTTLVACYALFSYLVFRIFRSRWLGAATMLLLIFNTAATAGSYFVANISYPFYFTFSLLLFMAGVLLYVNHYERGGAWRPWVGGLLIFVSFMFYETYMIFAVMLGLYVVARHWRREGFRSMWRNRGLWREALPLAIGAVAYVAMYFGYRRWLLSVMPDITWYDGANFSKESFSIRNFFKVLSRCTLVTLPGQPYFYSKWLVAENSLALGGHRNSPLFILGHASAVVWLNAILQCGLLWWLTKCQWFRRLSWRKIAAGFAGAVVVAYFAHTLIGLSVKYNVDWSGWMKGYVTSLYSYFGVALAIALAMAASLKAIRPSRWQSVVRGLWCVALLFFSIITGYTNEHLSHEWAKSQNRVKVLNLMAKEGFFDTLPDDALLITDELHNVSNTAFSITNGTHDIEDLINFRAKSTFMTNHDKNYPECHDNPDAPVYYFHAVETRKAGELLVAVALLDSLPASDSTPLTASRAELFYLSPSKSYTVIFRDSNGWHTLDFEAGTRQRLTRATVEADGLNPKSIIISNMTTHQQYEP